MKLFELSDLVVSVVNDLTKRACELVARTFVPDHRSDKRAPDPICKPELLYDGVPFCALHL